MGLAHSAVIVVSKRGKVESHVFFQPAVILVGVDYSVGKITVSVQFSDKRNVFTFRRDKLMIAAVQDFQKIVGGV